MITLETALSGGLVLRGMDSWLRTLTDLRKTYRLVAQTEPAIALCQETLKTARSATWLLDRPVSNSGRLAAMLHAHGFEALCVDDVDGELIARGGDSPAVVATADSRILDQVPRAADLPARCLASRDIWLWDFTALKAAL